MVEECKNNGDALENDSGNVEEQEKIMNKMKISTIL